jgi:hypothetical protein
MSKEEIAEQLYSVVEREVKDLFGVVWEEYKDELRVWVEDIVGIKLEKKLKGSTPELETNLLYALAAIRALKQRVQGKVEDGVIAIVERVLEVIARTFFTVAFGALI